MVSSTVICKTISNFDDSCFEKGDKFRFAIIVSQHVLADLGDTEEYDYVRVTPHGSDESGTLAQIVGFSDDYSMEEYSTDGISWACVRTSLQKEIGLGPDIDRDTRIVIQECEIDALDSLTIHRESAWETQDRNITTDGITGYINSEDMNDLESLDDGDVAELVNPRTGSRIRVPIQTYRHKNYQSGTIRLDGTTRELLNVESKDEGDDNSVRLRVIPDEYDETEQYLRRFSKWIGRKFVDYSYTHLRVLPGYDRDEGRNVVRINQDAMERLGIEDNDRVIIGWGDRFRNVTCQTGWDEDEKLEPKSTYDSYGEEESLSIRIPSTERDNLNISVGDSVSVRRDMRYQAGKQVSLSVFGILGVLIGTNQLINMFYSSINVQYIIVSILSIILPSLVAIWLILMPVRQKCRAPS